MKATLKIKNQEIAIDLTLEQVASITKESIHYTDIKSLEDALAYNGESIEEFNHRTQFDNDQQRAGKELEVINQALRMGNPLGDYWYYPVFNSARSASGFSFFAYYFDYAYSYVGSRLCVEDSDKAEYSGKTFLSIWDRYING
ncbi:hypothetical protein [Sphingobacterium thalpophilum]|uniref:hypothetical protein n=1 Tax=Sphingobacterium thalpophilum TaxID=259 RepID=UPI0024A79C80|nr:hypothetical protein [Sphingobacterium thalpophilum]